MSARRPLGDSEPVPDAVDICDADDVSLGLGRGAISVVWVCLFRIAWLPCFKVFIYVPRVGSFCGWRGRALPDPSRVAPIYRPARYSTAANILRSVASSWVPMCLIISSRVIASGALRLRPA